jgi:ribonuclease I
MAKRSNYDNGKTADDVGPEVTKPGASCGPSNYPAGRFDFFVLSLSWSPQFCSTPAGRKSSMQCGGSRAYGFVLHGLWPQYGKTPRPRGGSLCMRVCVCVCVSDNHAHARAHARARTHVQLPTGGRSAVPPGPG